MNNGLLATVLPALEVQQICHATVWLVLLCWCSVAFLPVQDRRWRWMVCGMFWTLVMVSWSWPLSALGLAFQTPSLLTLCLCLGVAWRDIRQLPERLIYSNPPAKVSVWIWLILSLTGWLLVLDSFGQLPWDLYPLGFEHNILWLGWSMAMLWLLIAYLLGNADWQAQAAGCWLLATGLFVLTHGPSGNAWDAWLDPWLWLYAQAKLINVWRFQRSLINHS